MKVMLDFMRTMLLMHPGWLAWIGLLLAVNMIVPLFFLPGPEAIAAIAAIMIGAVTQMVIFSKLGFVRLLGIGHFWWFVLLPWLLTRFDILAPQGPKEIWLTCLVVVNGLSLLIDMADVGRFLRGEREPILEAR